MFIISVRNKGILQVSGDLITVNKGDYHLQCLHKSDTQIYATMMRKQSQ